MHKKWTTQEDQIMREHYPMSTIDELLCLLPDRNLNTISYRARFLRLKKQRKKTWSKSEDEILQSVYATAKMQDLLEALPSKSRGVIYQRAFHLGLKRARPEQKKCPGCGLEIARQSKQCRQCYESRERPQNKKTDSSQEKAVHKRDVIPKPIRYLPWEKMVLAELGRRVSMTELRMLLPRRSRKQIKEMAAAFHVDLLGE